jgi:hypothetical protein
MDIFCEQSQPDYQQLECGAELGGVIAIGLIKPSYTIAATDTLIAAQLATASFWTTAIAASPQYAWKVLDTRGELPAGSPTEEEGFGLTPTERTGDDREITFDALGVMNNRDFWSIANKKRNWQMVYVTAERNSSGNFAAFYVADVSLYVSDVVPRSVKSRKMWTGSAKWSTAMTPGLPFFAPASVFTT